MPASLAQTKFTSIWVSFILAVCLMAASSMAKENQKFALIKSNKTNATFEFEDQSLNFSTHAPKDFIWNNADDVPPEFVSAGTFSSLTRRYLGYNPVNRDRFEISIFTGTIFPDRVALANGYSQILASRWGKLNFGVQATSTNFGEVLGGDDSSGVMFVNRITTIRRGEHLIVIRAKFGAEHFDQYANDIATFVGSVDFANLAGTDPIESNFKVQEALAENSRYTFTYLMPGNWELLKSEYSGASLGQIDLWIDASDPNRNSGVMVTVAPPARLLESGASVKADDQKMANFSAELASVIIQNLLPGQPYNLEPVEKNTFSSFEKITSFHNLFTYKAQLGQSKSPGIVSVAMTLGFDGSLICSTILTVAPVDLYLMGTKLHANFVQKLLLDAQKEHWQGRQRE